MYYDVSTIVNDKYKNIRSHAFWTRMAVDTSFPEITKEDIKNYKLHLQDCIDHPTRGLLAKREYVTGVQMHCPKQAKLNMRNLKKQPEIHTMQKCVDKTINTLYPKTRSIRQYIIDNDRIQLGKVNKIRKYTLFNKINILFKKLLRI